MELAGSRLHQPGFVRHRPGVERFPKVGDNGFVNVPTVGIDLWVHMSRRTEGNARRVYLQLCNIPIFDLGIRRVI